MILIKLQERNCEIAKYHIGIGKTVQVKGPLGKLDYLGRGKLTINGIERYVKSFCMICGGSGITPIFQILRAIIQDKEDHTKCVVFNGNRSAEDILCKAELDTFATSEPEKCKML